MHQAGPVVAIIGSVSEAREETLGLLQPQLAHKVAEEIGRELAKAGFRLLVYSADPQFLEADVVHGFISARVAAPGSIQVRYSLADSQPAFPDEAGNEGYFDPRPDSSEDWEVAFYRSLEDVHGVVLIGGGQSTLISGLVALGRRTPVLILPAFGGMARKVWRSLSNDRDLVSPEDIAFMARSQWTSDSAKECVQILLRQRDRLRDEEQKRRSDELRASGAVTRQAIIGMILFLVALSSVPVAWAEQWIEYRGLLWLLFFSPLLGGVSGATIRMVFDWRQGAISYTPQSAWITSALGLIAGGVSGLLFISAQLTALPSEAGELMAKVQEAQASRLVPFALTIGFVAGLTLDAVLRKLSGLDVVRSEHLEANRK